MQTMLDRHQAGEQGGVMSKKHPDALTVTVSYAYVDSETRTERMGTWTGLRRSAIEAAIQYLGWDELGQHIETDEDDLVELGAGLIAAGRGDYSAAVYVYSLWAQGLWRPS